MVRVGRGKQGNAVTRAVYKVPVALGWMKPDGKRGRVGVAAWDRCGNVGFCPLSFWQDAKSD